MDILIRSIICSLLRCIALKKNCARAFTSIQLIHLLVTFFLFCACGKTSWKFNWFCYMPLGGCPPPHFLLSILFCFSKACKWFMSNEIFYHVKRENFDNKLRVTVYFKSHKDFVNLIWKHGGIFFSAPKWVCIVAFYQAPAWQYELLWLWVHQQKTRIKHVCKNVKCHTWYNVYNVCK